MGGVLLGVFLSTHLRKKYSRADPLICGIGLIVSCIFISTALLVARIQVIAAFVAVVFGCFAINLNWCIVADIVHYVVLPNRRSTAGAFQILISHLLGDAGSPYIIGVIIDAVRSGITDQSEFCANLEKPFELISLSGKNVTRCEVYRDFYVTQYSLMVNVAVQVLGGIIFFITAVFIVKDKLRVIEHLAIQPEEPQQDLPEHSIDETDENLN